MPEWVFNVSQFPAFNITFSTIYWVGIFWMSVLMVFKIIKEIDSHRHDDF